MVAEEVQRLAESARQATGQIAQLVQGIQVETGDTLLTMNRLISQVVRQSEQAQQAGEQMVATRDTTAELVNLVRQIAGFSEQQSTLARELRVSVDRLNRGSVQTILAIEQQTESAATLVDYARRLSESVGQFKRPRLHDEDRGAAQGPEEELSARSSRGRCGPDEWLGDPADGRRQASNLPPCSGAWPRPVAWSGSKAQRWCSSCCAKAPRRCPRSRQMRSTQGSPG